MSNSPRRALTEGEIALAREAFGDSVDYAVVRIRHGAGLNPIARVAFLNRWSTAITLIGTIFFRYGPVADYSKADERARALFVHEMTHIWQYQTIGIVPFFLRYVRELDACDFRPMAMYCFAPGATPFAAASLEAQAEMVSRFDHARRSRDESTIALIGRNLAGSGLYGL